MLEKFIDNKLAQMLLGQKCTSDKSGLGFIATSSDVSNIALSSKTVFVKPKVEEPQNVYMDKGKGIVGDEAKVLTEPVKKPPNKKKFTLMLSLRHQRSHPTSFSTTPCLEA